MTSWDLSPPQRHASTQWVAARLSIPWDICWVISDPALDQVWSCINLVNTTLLYLVIHWEWISLEYDQRLFQGLSLTGSQQAEAGEGGSWGYFGLLLICPQPKPTMMWSLIFPVYNQAQQRQPQTVDHSIPPDCQGPIKGSIWLWPAPESLPRGPRTNTLDSQLQATSEQDPISFTSSISKQRSCETP